MIRVHSVRSRTVPVVVVLFALCVIFAYATGFWLLFRLAYVLLVAVPLSYFWAKFNINNLEIIVERLVDRAQVGQYAEERITLENPGLFPRIWLEVEDPSPLPDHHQGRVITLSGKT
ncbi:MAG TPA: DUF58 domain-containing protein, partial [Dehalococcoidia bacterium]|nr:DUF58 domain-containing protein [Dehalococcoidia bacterium]